MEYKSYNTTIENVVQALKRDGVAVIPNLLDHHEIIQMRVQMWEMLVTITSKFEKPITCDPKTWDTFYKLRLRQEMMLHSYGVGHSQLAWDLRQNPKVAAVFAKIWNCNPEELITSFDGMSISFPPETTGRPFPKFNPNLHTDQSFSRNDLECVQGFITGFDVEEGDATLTVLERSHQYHGSAGQFADKTDPRYLEDYCKINDQMRDLYKKNGCFQTFIKCPAGSLVLWDSRTIHNGAQPTPGRPNPKMRLVVYICQVPRRFATEEVLESKRKAFENNVMTTHWPNKSVTFDHEKPVSEDNNEVITSLPKPVLTELGMKLAGY